MEEDAVFSWLLSDDDIYNCPHFTPFPISSSSSSFHFHQLLFPRLWFLNNLDDSPIIDGGNLTNMMVIRAGKSLNFKMSDPPPPPQPGKKCRNYGGRPSQSSSTSSEVVMQIWKEFPEDLMEVVIARLPIDTLFRFRLVCRKWNSLLSSSHSFFSQVPQAAQPWFYTVAHENLTTGAAMYDPCTKKWRHPTIPRLRPPKVYLLPVASAGGLICFFDIGLRYFYVCNPLSSQSWKELPARSVEVWSLGVAVGMVWNRKKNCCYKIIWVGHNGEHEVYDSVDDSWTRPGHIPQEIKLPLYPNNFRSSHTVTIDATVYFLRSGPEGIVSYDLESGVWKQLLVPTPPHSTDYTLAAAECGGGGSRIMLVGLLTKNAVTCVCVWELQKMTLLWKEVDRMPNIWCLEFYGKHVRMTCLGNKSLLMLSLRSRQMNWIVSYDVSKREWLKVPRCALSRGRGRKRQSATYGTAFHPCPTSAP
ncbi:hypothetical protein Dimus_015270 [Dionaea muscipula]